MYYPYGMVMPGRNTTGSPDYPKGYQGAYTRKDNEDGTEWDAFELRMYDSRMARWMSRDPYRQYASPYISMGNNPVSTVDPDGGFSVTTAQAIVGGVGFVAGGVTAYNAAGGTSGGLKSAGLGFVGAAVGAAAGYGLASIDYGAALNGIGNGLEAAGKGVGNFANKNFSIGNQIALTIVDTPKDFDRKEYRNSLKKRLVEQGFNKDTKVSYDSPGLFQSIFGNNGSVTVQNYVLGRDRGAIDAGGYAILGDPHSIRIYSDLSGRRNPKNSIPTWKFVNATMHEIGHAFFRFKHNNRGFTKDPNSIMDYRSTNKKGAGFNTEQRSVIKNSVWGQ